MPVDASGRALAADGPLRDRRAVQAHGPQGRRPRARDDPRGGRDLPRLPARALLPRAAADPLPPPDQGARRAAPARGPAAHPRVHHEGLLLLRRRPRRASRPATTKHSWPTRGSSTAPGLQLVRRRVRRRDDGRHRRARVHGAVPGRRERRRARARATPPTSRSRAPTRSPSSCPRRSTRRRRSARPARRRSPRSPRASACRRRAA